MKYGDDPLDGHWLLGNGGDEDEENIFVCSFHINGYPRDFHFLQVKKSPMYRYCAPRPENNAFLVFLPDESW